MAKYGYRPLGLENQEIRLIHLLPGEEKDPIRICMVHEPFSTSTSLHDAHEPSERNAQLDSLRTLVSHPWTIEEVADGDLIKFNVFDGSSYLIAKASPASQDVLDWAPKYDALSYTWGVDDIQEYALVEKTGPDPKEPPSRLGIRPNLASALRHLRHRDTMRVLWIDAICINQEDIEERNVQVKRMTDIYKFAQRVVAWLGEKAYDSSEALSVLRHVSRQITWTKAGRIIRAPDATEPNWWRNDTAVYLDDKTWQAVTKFMERAWFYRLWCWQEIQLGGLRAHVQCGTDTMRWTDFWLAILCLHNKDSSHSIWFREHARHIAYLRQNAATDSMCNILDVSRSKGCSDPRDKIYGLLGLTPPIFASNIVVDYLRPTELVYRDALLAHMRTTNRLELLKHCDLASRQIAGPSWVPDWSRTEFAAPILSEQLCTGISRAYATFIEPDVLEVIGKQSGIVKTVSAMASKEEETLLAVKDWFRLLPQEKSYFTGEAMQQAFALTLCMDRTHERHPYTHFPCISEWVSMLHDILGLTKDTTDAPIYGRRETANTIQKVRGRRFFITEEGYIGTAPAGVQVGDFICLILGAYSPIVLRPLDCGRFKVVGECYVHGLSFSNGLLGPLPDPWRAIIKGDSLGRQTQLFAKSSFWAREETADDPRLGDLSGGWEKAPYERLPDDPAIFWRYKNAKTNERINYDPRLSLEALEARGVSLQSFRLV